MRKDYFLIAGLAALFFIPYLGAVHLFDWDEINFAECAREMLLTGDWFRPQIDFEPFWEKPPLFLWMQALSMSIFGINEFGARFPNAVCGIATLLLVYRIGFRLHDRALAWLWVLAWMGSILPHLYFRSGIIDPWFNLFIFAGIYGFIEFRWQFFMRREVHSFWINYRYLIFGGLAMGLAILTKGPTALLIAWLTLGLYWARYRFRGRGYFRHLVLYSLAATVAPLIWFGLEYMLHGPWFITEFFWYQLRLLSTPDSGHGGFIGYHVVVLLLGCFPISAFALANLWGDRQSEAEMMDSDTLDACKRSDFGTWMQILFWVVLVLFSLVRTKIVHYSSLAYFPMTYLGAVVMWRALKWDKFPRISIVVLGLLGLLIGGIVMALPWIGMHLEQIKPLFQRDPFALANLDAQVAWHLWEGLPGLLLIIGTSWGAYRWYRRRHAMLSAQIIFVAGALFTAFTLLLIVPNIECYTQGAAIEFYEKHCGKDHFIRPIPFKSYAHLFYACKKPISGDPKQDDQSALLDGSPEKPCFFVAKINNTVQLEIHPHFREMYRKNGFVFFERVNNR